MEVTMIVMPNFFVQGNTLEKTVSKYACHLCNDLADIYPGYVCEAWLGHTGKIADKHYRQVTESHFEKTAGVRRTENHTADVNLQKPR
jgi:hypothetical protein